MSRTPERKNPQREQYGNNMGESVDGTGSSLTTPLHQQLEQHLQHVDDDNDDDEGRVEARTTPFRRQRRGQETSATPSSWAQESTPRLRTQISMLRYPDRSSQPNQPPTHQNASRSSGTSPVALDDISLPPPPDANNHRTQKDRTSKSFKGWLMGSLAGTLNTAAGLTLSATNTVAAPAVSMTQNVILPSLLALLVDTLDQITPTFVKDWFRILTSSLYHLYSVLSSTDRGKVLQYQFRLVLQNVLEAWSAPEARQVVVDGMAAGVKLADALHTPEMLLFLEQASVLGCRVVDAMSSGKTKQLIHNTKDLMWKGIELAVDPASTVAYAEVTAHLCHALEETAESINYYETAAGGGRATPRTGVTSRNTRNTQNEETYLRPMQMTDYRKESIENVILSSLGLKVDPDAALQSPDLMYYGVNSGGGRTERGGGGTDNDDEDDDDDTSAARSIPSNVTFPPGGNIKLSKDQQDALWRDREERVNVDLLRERILHHGRPQARPSTTPSEGDDDNDDNNNNDPVLQVEEELQDALDLEEVPDFDRPTEGTTSRNNAYFKEVNDKLDVARAMEKESQDESGAARFYHLVDAYLEEKRLKKDQDQAALDEEESTVGADGTTNSDGNTRRLRARVRKMKVGTERRALTRKAKEKYTKLQRIWKYQPFLMRVTTFFLASIAVFWIAFGLYGMYTVVQVVYFQGASPRNFLHPLQGQRRESQPYQQNPVSSHSDGATSPHNPNEMVIRIVREVVHVREDGSKIIDGANLPGDASFSREEMNSVMECVAAMEEKTKTK